MVLSSPALLRQWIDRHVRKIVRSNRGSVLILSAVAAPVLFLIVGFAIDYAYASMINQRLARASDAATLAAVSQSAASAVGGYSNTTGLQAYGVRVFNENMAAVTLANVSFNLSVTQDPNTLLVTASSTYSYNVPTFFAGILGRSNIPVSGSITSVAQPPTYVNYYILVDVSNSMGIGATQADMNALWTATSTGEYGIPFSQDNSIGCVFACHIRNSNQFYSTEYLARKAGVTLRIDSAVSALQTIISAAATIAGTTKNISFGIYLLERDPTTGKYLTKLQDPPINNYASLTTSAGTIGLGNTQGLGDTDLQTELSTFNALLPSNGTGASAASPLNYVFLITDGLVDLYGYNGCNSTSCMSVMNPTWCNGIKTKSTLGVIYTTYLPLWKNNDPSTRTYEGLYNTFNIQSFQANIGPNLQNCATSSDYFFEAQDGPSISSTMQALFAKTQPVSARLTQ